MYHFIVSITGVLRKSIPLSSVSVLSYERFSGFGNGRQESNAWSEKKNIKYAEVSPMVYPNLSTKFILL